ncbi:MAG: type IV pilus secretin PilQ [Proteobacteria bacterium]|nr:type IV pilus secretin PilQ [Pseudomonadota bacterium]
MKKPQKMSFDFVDADVRNVLRGLADVMERSIIIGDDLKELKDKTVTMKLDNVSMEEALDIIIKSKDLSKFEEGNIIRVITLKKFLDEKNRESADKAALQREKLEKLKQGEEFVTETIFVNYTTANKVARVIKGEATTSTTGAATAGAKGLLSEYGTVTEVEWTNAIIVKDTKEKVAVIKEIVSKHDFPPVQIQIHARIVIADTNFQRDLGIKWNVAMQGTSNLLNRDMSVKPGINSMPAAQAGALQLLVGDAAASFFLDATIAAAETDGIVKTIANPKVITSDNITAKISKGNEIPYQTVAMAGASPTIEYKKAELSLEVTPHATKDGRIKMKIKATKNDPYNWNPTTIAMSTKEASTDVIIKDGETVVIGGIYETTNDDTETGIPLLMKIPILGWLFKNQHKKDTKNELLIFVTPTILKTIYKDEG